MRRQLRIDYAGLLEPHDHVAWYGDGDRDLYSVASAALAAGVRRNEKLMFVAQDPDPTQLQSIEDLEYLLAVDQLELADIDAVYGNGGDFSAAAQLETFQEVLADAQANGFSGIRVVADNTPLVRGDDAGFRRWLAWEQLTDRFQAASMVTGVCYFDRRALGDERLSDLAAVHPVRSVSGVEPPFALYVDGDAISVTGTLDSWSTDRFRRVVETTPDDGPLILDLSTAEFVDHRALLVLAETANTERPIHVRGTEPIRKLLSLIGLETPDLRFELVG